MAESFGLRAGISTRTPVRKALETVLMLDPGFQQGSADRALGRWYLKVPRLFGGSKDESVEHLKRSLTYDQASTASHYFLAETYLEMDRRDEARRKHRRSWTCPLTRTGRRKIASSSRKQRPSSNDCGSGIVPAHEVTT